MPLCETLKTKSGVNCGEGKWRLLFWILWYTTCHVSVYSAPLLHVRKFSALCLPKIRSDQIRSVAQSCPTLCNPMNRSMPVPHLPVPHQLPEFTQTHVHRVSDATQPSHPLLSPSPPAPNPSQHQSLFQWVNSSHEVAKSQIEAKNYPSQPSLWHGVMFVNHINSSYKGLIGFFFFLIYRL